MKLFIACKYDCTNFIVMNTYDCTNFIIMNKYARKAVTIGKLYNCLCNAKLYSVDHVCIKIIFVLIL